MNSQQVKTYIVIFLYLAVPLLTIISLALDDFVNIDIQMDNAGNTFESDFKLGISELDATLKGNGNETKFKKNPYSCSITELNNNSNHPFHCINNSPTCTETRAISIVSYVVSSLLLVSLIITYMTKYKIPWINMINLVLLISLLIFNGVINNYFYSMVDCVNNGDDIPTIFTNFKGEIDNLQVSSILGIIAMIIGVILLIIFTVKFFKTNKNERKTRK